MPKTKRFKSVRLNQAQMDKVATIKSLAIELEKEISTIGEVGLKPTSERYVEESLLKLETSVMFANKAISRNTDYIN